MALYQLFVFVGGDCGAGVSPNVVRPNLFITLQVLLIPHGECEEQESSSAKYFAESV